MDPFTIATIGSAVIGGLAGASGSSGQSKRVSTEPASPLERNAINTQNQGFYDLNQIMTRDFGRANQASQAYGRMLQEYSQSGGLPTNQDLSMGRSFAEQMLAPQRAQIDLSMRQSTEQARQQAALSGRGPNDFAMNSRLGQQRNDFMNQLGAQQSAMGMQYAQQASQNRLGYAGQYADLQQGLASQAMQNRMAIMGLGSQIQNVNQNYRLGTATTSTPGTPGGLMGGLTGALMGAQVGMNIGKNFFGAPTQPQVVGSNAGGIFSAGAQEFTMPQLGSSAVGSPGTYGLGANYGGASPSRSAGGGGMSVPAASTQLPQMGSSSLPASMDPVMPFYNQAQEYPGYRTPWAFDAMQPQPGFLAGYR